MPFMKEEFESLCVEVWKKVAADVGDSDAVVSVMAAEAVADLPKPQTERVLVGTFNGVAVFGRLTWG